MKRKNILALSIAILVIGAGVVAFDSFNSETVSGQVSPPPF